MREGQDFPISAAAWGARYVYNHIVEAKMVLWLIDAAGVDRALVDAGRRAADSATGLGGKSKAIRAVVGWEVVARALGSLQAE